MPKFKFGKLVRDKIIERQITSGAIPKYRQLTPTQHKQELVNKIIEEAQEIVDAPQNELANEIADVQQALDDLRSLHHLTEEEIKKAQKLKNDKNGAFRKGLFVEYVELDAEDEWVQYYRENADRYPEID